MEISTSTYEPIKVYREGKFDRKYWYTLQTKRYLKEKLTEFAHQVDVVFVEHRFDTR